MIFAASLCRLCALFALLQALAGCADVGPAQPLDPTPTFQPKSSPSAQPSGPLIVGARNREVVTPGPVPPVNAAENPDRPTGAPPPLTLKSTSEALNLEQVTLPAFINEVFSKTLSLTVQIDQRVTTRTDVVTLRTGRPLPSEDLFQMAQNILAGYGIGVSWDGTVLHIAPEDALMAQMPELVRSRSLPEMPVTLRPIFQIVDLHQVSAADMSAWLTSAYGARVKVFTVGRTAAVMVFGLPENVRAAVEAIGVLDQARLAGRQSLQVTPVYWTARDLAAKLVDVLRAEGYDVAVSSGAAPNQTSTVMLIPVEANNSLIAFAADAKILAHIRQWTTDLDQAGQADPLRSIFVYQVQNTTATSLGQIVQDVLSGRQRPAGPTTEVPLERAGRTGTPGTAPPGAAPGPSETPSPGVTAGGAQPAGSLPGAPGSEPALPPDIGQAAGNPGSSARIVIDPARNALILIGTAQDYQRIRPLLAALDRSPREALIEVTVAELTLNDSENLGLDWAAVNHIGNGLIQQLGTTAGVGGLGGGIALGTSGFNYTILNGVGDVRVILNAFAENNHLSVLSTPRVLAKSGSEAKIEVGTEVPIITSQGSTNTIQNAGTTGILQSIDYRKTGILLTVRPTVHSGDRIDLRVSQEVSAALPNSTPGISSPLIQNRNVLTELTLKDGQTVVIGGLISENRTVDDSGVPILKDIPGVGNLFRNQSVTKDRTELLVFITPYVISSEADANAITDQFRSQMQSWPVPNPVLRW
jgi:general secretion pathway protein D